MDRAAKDPLKKEKKEGVEALLNSLFPLGDAKEVSSSLAASLEQNTQDSLLQTAAHCRKSREAYAKWIFAYIDKLKQGFITEDSLKAVFLSFSHLTGINSSSQIKTEKITENQFISMCLASGAFKRSWISLRKHTKLNL